MHAKAKPSLCVCMYSHVFEELWIETLFFEFRGRDEQALYTAIQKSNNLFAFIWVGGWKRHLKSDRK